MKKETLRENLPVIIAIGLPVLLVLSVALLTWLPSFGPKPSYDFLFIKDTSRSYYEQSSCVVYSNYYEVKDGYLTKKPYVTTVFDKREVSEPCYGFSSIIQKDAPQIYLYSMLGEGSYRPIDFEAASNVQIKSTDMSPDGFSVSKRIMNRGLFDLFGGSTGGVYLSKKNRYTKIDITDVNTSSYYDQNFTFLGWVEPYTIGK